MEYMSHNECAKCLRNGMDAEAPLDGAVNIVIFSIRTRLQTAEFIMQVTEKDSHTHALDIAIFARIGDRVARLYLC